MIRNTLASIIELFEADRGSPWNKNEREYAFQKWEALNDKTRQFLDSLSDGDLDNVCIGEVRVDEGGEDIWLYSGSWKTLPSAVNKFLTDIWEYAS